MMYANLVDLEDFIFQLKQLGIEVAPNANVEQVKAQLTQWLATATPNEVKAFKTMSRELAVDAEVLPEVEPLLAR
ncbi:hypothetical protein M1D72_17040 [Vibrio sp. AK197]|uniref:Uncharacterized protein n=1 Tax=Vibrio olivae TaxID=1243002 RepID=A0ABV5HHI1_9VIBR